MESFERRFCDYAPQHLYVCLTGDRVHQQLRKMNSAFCDLRLQISPSKPKYIKQLEYWGFSEAEGQDSELLEMTVC